jgi:hypothetical protein
MPKAGRGRRIGIHVDGRRDRHQPTISPRPVCFTPVMGPVRSKKSTAEYAETAELFLCKDKKYKSFYE